MTDPFPSNPLAEALDNPAPAPELAQAGDRIAERSEYERPPFPAGGPVQPLGISAGIDGSQKCYYLDYNGQLVGLEAGNRHGKNSLIALYGPQSDWIEAQWPQWSAPQYEGRGKDRELVKASEIVGFDQAEASRALIEECVRKGIFDPAGRMRGRGAHRIGGDGGHGNGLALHCGDALLVSEMKVDGTIKGWRWIDPGLHGRFVYPAAERIPRPWHEPAGEAPGVKLLQLLQSWTWKRPVLDPLLALGAIGASPIGGWLAWRPNVWISGGKGTGKSTLNGQDGLLHLLLGDGLFRTGNASAAGIRQSLKNATVPVLFDEIEASEDNRRVKEVIELARVASSGDKMTRGSADHTAQEFTLRSVFWFSSILIPPLEPQDRSRLALLELKPFPDKTKPIDLNALGLPKLGRQLQRRMVDGLHRLHATKAKFHAALAELGHDNRACDQFGTLLACADLLLNDWPTKDVLPDDEAVNDWVALCRPERMAEISGATSEERAAIEHIVTSPMQSRGGEEREAISTWIGRALNYAWAPLLAAPHDELNDSKEQSAGRKLEQLGLKLVTPVWTPPTAALDGSEDKPGRWGAKVFENAAEPGFLAVAWRHRALDEVFKGSKWQGGVWRQPLARCDGAIDGVKVSCDRLKVNAVLVPLCAVFDDEDLPEASRREAVLEWMAAQVKGA